MNEDGPKLLIVESPAKIKTISKFLGKDFKILSTFGHVKDLPPRKLGVVRDDKNHFDLEYVTIKDKGTKISDICKQAQQSSAVYLASDPDREGEIIAWHISQEVEKVFADPSKIYRITFNEITKSALLDAINNKRSVDMDKVNAQQARRILDRWVGYEVSPILWKKIGKGLSAGRVQSVAVYLVCTREDEIKNFVQEESWTVHVLFVLTDGSQVRAELAKINAKAAKLKNKQDVDALLPKLGQQDYVVTKITEKERAKNPLPPFMTSTLQQDAYNKLGFSVDKTMSVAQRLYEGVALQDKNSPEALITYMRTDSVRIADSALDATRAFITKEYGQEYLPKSAHVYEKKSAQDAHEAIRPIEVSRHPRQVAAYLSSDEAKLYELIWKRFVACQMQAAKYFQRQVLIDGGPYSFKATGSTLMFDGFLRVYLADEEEESEENVKIPASLKVQDPLNMKQVDPKQHFTQPPPRYTEATLVKELEKRGIGRPSTYATILSTIQKRGYVNKEAKRFGPTELGRAVNDLLVAHLSDIINVSFTAKMEEDLDKIAAGQVDRDKVLSEFYDKFKKDLTSFGVLGQERKAVPTDIACPQCKSPLVLRLSKNGEFLGCSTFPTCSFTGNVTRDEQGKLSLATGPQEGGGDLDLTCPNCGKPLTRKMGRFGPFIACSGYPECKYIHQEALKTPCPQCGGKITKRRWKGGTFWGCSSYPDCKYAIFGAVVEVPCKKCKAPLMTVVKDRQGNVMHVCADKACGYSEAVPS